MCCLHCGGKGFNIINTEMGLVLNYCSECALGNMLTLQICPTCGCWRGPKDSKYRCGAPLCQCKRPMAGDAVLLTAPWSIAPAKSWGVIGGMCSIEDDFLHICFHANCFNDGHSVSCSGGPATIALPAFLLIPSDGIKQQNFWKWKDVPRAGGGIGYSTEVPVWEWNGIYIIMKENGEVIDYD